MIALKVSHRRHKIVTLEMEKNQGSAHEIPAAPCKSMMAGPNDERPHGHMILKSNAGKYHPVTLDIYIVETKKNQFF